jgi:hypothetical protein
MATTTNYSWTTPDDTALVKDGAAAIRSLGTSIDTTTKNLNPSTTTGDIEYRSSTPNVNTRLPLGTAGQVLKVNSGATAPEWATDATGMTNPMTTTGDTIYSSSGSTPDRLPIGSTGNVLTVAGGVPTWAAPAAASQDFTLLNAGGTALTGAQTITVSGISGKNEILVVITNASSASASSTFGVQLNTDTGNNYNCYGNKTTASSAYAAGSYTLVNSSATSSISLATMANAAASGSGAFLRISGCNSTGAKVFSGAGGASLSTGSGQILYNVGGYYTGSSTVSSVSIYSDTGNFDNGTVFIYASA